MEQRNRKIKHADEQLKRSGRLLYVLQRRVEELNRHINQKSFNVKHTKKVCIHKYKCFLFYSLWVSGVMVVINFGCELGSPGLISSVGQTLKLTSGIPTTYNHLRKWAFCKLLGYEKK